MLCRTPLLVALALVSTACGQLQPITIYGDLDDTADDFADTGDDLTDDLADTGDLDSADPLDDQPDPPRDPVDTGDDEPETSPPELLSLEVTDAGNGFADLAFEAFDPDGDLDRLRVMYQGWATDLFIPDDIDEWNPGGVSHVRWQVGVAEGCGGTSAQFEARVLDTEGRPSNALVDSMSIEGASVHSAQEREPNGWRSDATPIGSVSRPLTITGSSSGFSDDDYVAITVCDTGSWTFTLTWAGSHTDIDLDLHLYNAGGTKLASAFTYDYPERLTYSLSAGTTYYLRVGAWDAASGWTITAQ